MNIESATSDVIDVYVVSCLVNSLLEVSLDPTKSQPFTETFVQYTIGYHFSLHDECTYFHFLK